MHYVHAHPVEHGPHGASSARGGPVLTFEAMFPATGNYRVWMQFKRGGTLATSRFDVSARGVPDPAAGAQ
jgi:hypothetical protein